MRPERKRAIYGATEFFEMLTQKASPMAGNCRSAVAVVDDDVAVLDSLKFLLEVEGYKVETYSSALALLEDPTPRSSCLIVDQHMPKMTGLELTAELRAKGMQIPILLITAAPSPAIIAEAAQLGIEKVLEKPAVEGDLLNFVAAYN
jgi:two-component system response regulator FixJ